MHNIEREMQAATNSVPGGSMTSKVIFVVVMLVLLYFLYQFLFSPSGLQGNIVVNAITPSNPSTPIIVQTGSGISSPVAPLVPVIYEGGEFSINTWIYLNDYSINRGKNKHLLNLGGASFSSLAVYLGPYNSSLAVRVQTSTPSTGISSAELSDSTVDLTTKTLASVFTSLQSGTSLLDSNTPCDIHSLELQKWVQVTICLNNKTCDVYIDGKLARSCMLPSFYRVDKNNFKLTMCDYGGFGGYVSKTSVYNYALNPEQVWRLYMNGPGPQYTFMQYVTSIFDPKASLSLGYPKQNITG